MATTDSETAVVVVVVVVVVVISDWRTGLAGPLLNSRSSSLHYFCLVAAEKDPGPFPVDLWPVEK